MWPDSSIKPHFRSTGILEVKNYKLYGSCDRAGKTIHGHTLIAGMSKHGVMICVVPCLQESLAEGVEKVDSIVESLNDVGLKDRSMIWNTDLMEVRGCALTPCFRGKIVGLPHTD